jgi:hypothetical protein
MQRYIAESGREPEPTINNNNIRKYLRTLIRLNPLLSKNAFRAKPRQIIEITAPELGLVEGTKKNANGERDVIKVPTTLELVITFDSANDQKKSNMKMSIQKILISKMDLSTPSTTSFPEIE